MNVISQKLHGVIDYAAALGLIILPFILGLEAQSPVGHWISVIAGLGLIGYSLLTDYSMSARQLISYNMHLFFDLSAAIAFLVLPFILGFEGIVFNYFIVMGIAVLAVVLLSDRRPEAA